ncbi:pre-mRNA-splicing regulator WTAP-like [Lycaon pictus]
MASQMLLRNLSQETEQVILSVFVLLCEEAILLCVPAVARRTCGLQLGFKVTNEEPLPKKVRLSETDIKVMAREEFILRWKQYEAYVQTLEGKYTDLNSNDGLRESEEKLKQQQESACRESILVMRLATKEQEVQECTTQIQYLKQVQQPSVAQLRSTMVDPAINLFFLKMKGELEQTKDNLKQAQNELSAWKFMPDRGLMVSDSTEEVATSEKFPF